MKKGPWAQSLHVPGMELIDAAEKKNRILLCRVKFGALKILGVNSILLRTNMIVPVRVRIPLDLHSNSLLVL